ncbi:DUF6471 domain-containing protein [Roseivirga spongicola]|uniref:DUF6471 domain-containing protein n=1 Tax=Roseivirga spongicola TaxID=333140 RepID=UPI000A9ED3AC
MIISRIFGDYKLKYDILKPWNEYVKRKLKSEMVKRGVGNDELVQRLDRIGVELSKTSLVNKISRGSFSAVFFIQCLYVIGCYEFEIEEPISMVAENPVEYKKLKKKS